MPETLNAALKKSKMLLLSIMFPLLAFGLVDPNPMSAVTGKFAPAGDNAWRLDDALTLRVDGGAKAFVRGEGDKQELLVSVRGRDGKNQLEVEYVW